MNLADVYFEYILIRQNNLRRAGRVIQLYMLEKQWEQEPVEPGNKR